ncbi:hypothetical protein TB2_005130 [Malus domestica]
MSTLPRFNRCPPQKLPSRLDFSAMAIQFKIRSSVLRRHRRPSLHLRSSISAAPCFNLTSSSSVPGSLQHHGPDSVVFLRRSTAKTKRAFPPTTLTMCPSCERVGVPPNSSSSTRLLSAVSPRHYLQKLEVYNEVLTVTFEESVAMLVFTRSFSCSSLVSAHHAQREQPRRAWIRRNHCLPEVPED